MLEHMNTCFKQKNGVKEELTLKEILPTKYSYFKDELYSGDVGEDTFELLCRKGVYTYEYMDSMKQNFQRRRNTTVF